MPFLVSAFFCGAQDIIIRKDGRTIACRILLVDSSVIVYRVPPKRTDAFIRRDEVQRYLYGVNRTSRDSVTALPREMIRFSLAFGRGKPIGDLASQDLNSPSSGLAFPGNMLSGGVAFMFSDFFGLGAGFRSQKFAFNDALYAEIFKQLLPGIDVRCVSAPWKINGLFARAILSVPMTPDGTWKLDFEGQAGVPRYNYPTIVTELSGNGGYLLITEYAPPVRAGTFIGGLRLNYRPSRGLMVFAQADYLTGKPTFVPVASFNGTSVSEIYSQKFDALSFGIGITMVVTRD